MFIIPGNKGPQLQRQKWAKHAITALFTGFFAVLLFGHAHSATLLPNGKQQFVNGNGVPLAGGTVYMFAPSTSVCKNTWQDAGQTQLNTCPIALDSNGMALIYGAGTYRQVVYGCSPSGCDSVNGILLYDQLTADTSASNAIFWAGLSGGTPNAVTAVDPSFSGTDGSVIFFRSLNTNTGPTSLNVSGFGAVPVVRDTTAGPIALTGGELTATNVVGVLYDATLVYFHLVAYAPPTGGGGAVTSSIDYPQGYLNLVGLSGGIVQTGDVTAATTVFYTPYQGNLIPIWNGSNFINRIFPELSLTLTASAQLASTIYDVCVFNNNGAPTLVTGPGWATSTAGAGARGSGAGTAQLIKLNGFWVNQFQITGTNGATSFTIPADQCTYVGSLAIDAAAGQVTAHRTYGQSRKFGVWNAYNRLPIILQVGDPTGSWNYVTTVSLRAADNNAANSLTVFSGLPEEQYDLQYLQKMQTSNASGATSNAQLYNGIGYNVTNASCGPLGSLYFNPTVTSGTISVGIQNTGVSQCIELPSIGINTVTALENVVAATTATVTYFGGVGAMLLSAKWRG